MYFLDNDILNYAFKDRDGAVQRRIRSTPPEDIAISSIIVEEMLRNQLDAINSARTYNRPLTDLYRFLVQLILNVTEFEIEAYSDEAESVYKTFSKRSTSIGKFDARLIAHAKVSGATIVTNNLDDFRKICEIEELPDVKIESWTR